MNDDIFLYKKNCDGHSMTRFELDDSFRTACRLGQLDRVIILIEEGWCNYYQYDDNRLCSFLNGGMKSACLAKQYEIVKFLLEDNHEALRVWLDYDEEEILSLALMHACDEGHIDIVKLVLSKKFTKKFTIDKFVVHIYEKASLCACKRGYREIVDLLIEHGAFMFDNGLRGACEGGHYDLVKRIIEHFERFDYCETIDDCFESACENGQYEIAKLLVSIGTLGVDLSKGLEIACNNHHDDLAMLIIDTIHPYEGLYDHDFRTILLHYEYDCAFVLRVLRHLCKTDRGRFVKLLKNYNNLRGLLLNLHLTRHSKYKEKKKPYVFYNVSMRLVCKDVATFLTRFIGFH